LILNTSVFANQKSYDFYLSCKGRIDLDTQIIGNFNPNKSVFIEEFVDEFKLSFKEGAMKPNNNRNIFYPHLELINSTHFLNRLNVFTKPSEANLLGYQDATQTHPRIFTREYAQEFYKLKKFNIELIEYEFDIKDLILEIKVRYKNQHSKDNLTYYTISFISGSYQMAGYVDSKSFSHKFISSKSNCKISKGLIRYLTNQSAEKKSKGSQSSGTAFFINDKGNLITNHHVVNGCDKLTISYLDKDYQVSLLHSDENLDLAVLKADMKANSYISLSKNSSKKLQDIYAAGYPLGKGLSNDLKITSGIVSSIKGYKDNVNQMQIDAAINPGNSGGPIVNENGYLVGIAVAGLDKSKTESVNFGIKSSSLEQFLNSNQIQFNKPFYEFSKNKDELRKLLENSTVYISCKN